MSECPFCRARLHEAPVDVTFRRHGREVLVHVTETRCPNDHPGDDGAPYHSIATQEQGLALLAAAAEEWRRKYGEDLPAPQRRRRRLAAVG